MSGKEYKVTIKEQEVKVGETDYVIKTDGENKEIKFKDGVNKGDKAEGKLKIKYVEKKDKGDEKKGKNGEVEVIYNGGFGTEGIKLEKKLDTVGDMKEEVKPSIGFFRAMRGPTYLSIIFFVIAIIGLIGGGIASSNKEDKEEESL